LLEAKVDAELERQAKEQLIEYYEKLTEEAALRERRALWRVERIRLKEKREKLMEHEAELWAAELQEKGVRFILCGMFSLLLGLIYRLCLSQSLFLILLICLSGQREVLLI
jgi:hypothetical protein